jgi:hypothetical protein
MHGSHPGRVVCSLLVPLAISVPGFAACRDARFKRGQRAERRGDLARAAELYRQAALACRADRTVLERLAAVRSALVQTLVAEADRNLLNGDATAARTRLQQALRLDPGASLARQRLQDLPSTVMPTAPALPEAPPKLTPLPGERSFDYRGDVMGAYQEVARQFGLSASFDPELPHRMIRFRIPPVDFPTAMRLLEQLTGTAWRPLSPRMFFVFADTPAKRQQYGLASVATVPLPEAATPDQMDALTRAVREVAGLTRTHLETGTRLLTLEGPRARVELARRLVEQLDHPAGEILLEVDLLEVDRQQAEQMGLTPPSSAQMFTLSPSQISQAQTSLEGLLDVLTQVFGQPSGLTGLDLAQVQALLSAGRLSVSSLLPPLVAFGGGRTRFLATLPGAAAQLSQTLTLVRSGQRLLLRGIEGRPATLFIGERFPVLLNTYAATLNAPAVVPTITSASFPRSDFPVGTHPAAVAAADFTGDGFADLAVANEGDGTVSILVNDGAGNFHTALELPVGAGPVALAVADLNGDGKPDLAVASRDANSISVFLGLGNGQFAPAQTYAVGRAPVALAAADFNGDGKPDLAVTNRDDNTVSILINRGDGTFQPPFDLPTGREPVALATGDFNGDKKTDLAIANQADNTVTLWQGIGDGTFTHRSDVPVGNAPSAVAAADFTGDGQLDLAVADRDDNTVAVLVGNGDGTFQPPVNFTTPAAPVALAVADFNLDGRPDLAVAARDSNQLSILVNNGAGNFTFRLDLGTGAAPVAVAAADFDHNGLPDAVVANRTDNTVSVLFNDIGLVPGNATTQVIFPAFEYVDLGLKLTVTPRLHPDGEATLEMRTEIVGLSGASVNGIPVLTHRSIEQQVRVREGEPSLVAALLNPQRTLGVTAWPGLAAAGAHNRQSSDTELLVVVRPRRIRTLQPKPVTLYAGTGRD